jgi:hypothetical protein
MIHESMLNSFLKIFAMFRVSSSFRSAGILSSVFLSQRYHIHCSSPGERSVINPLIVTKPTLPSFKDIQPSHVSTAIGNLLEKQEKSFESYEKEVS